MEESDREEGEVLDVEPEAAPTEQGLEPAPAGQDHEEERNDPAATPTAQVWHTAAALDFSSPPCRIRQATVPFKDQGNFTKGVKFSPDGTCLLTASEDNVLRVFEVPSQLLHQQQESKDGEGAGGSSLEEWPAVIESREGETIYDFAWYPLMQPSEPATCCYLSTSRDHPIHLWDAFTGQLRASYRAYDHMDELSAAYCVAFSPYGDKIFAGFNRVIRVFDTSEPGRSHQDRWTSKTKKSRSGQRGIISALAFCPNASGVHAAGSYSGTIGIYDDRAKGEALMEITGHDGGVTCLKISPDSRLLFSGARKDPYVHCWDIRSTGKVLSSFKRVASTNQRIGLDVDPTGRYLITGSRDHQALVYDLTTGGCVASIKDTEAVNDVAFHPHAGLVALGTGERHFSLQPTSDEPEDDDELGQDEQVQQQQQEVGENAVRLLKVAPGASHQPQEPAAVMDTST